MIFLAILCFFIVVGIVVMNIWKDKVGYDITGYIIMIYSSLVLALLIIAIPINRMDTISFINKMESTKQTLNYARQNKEISSIELAAIQQQVCEYNAKLANEQYWKKTIWGLWRDDKIIDVKPIR